MTGNGPFNGHRYNRLNEYIQKHHGTRAYKITVNIDLECPNKDGTKSSNGCTFCTPDTLLVPSMPDLATVSEQVESGIEVLSKRRGVEKFIAYFQLKTSTNAPVEKLRALYEEALINPLVAGLAISTRPDCVGEEVMELLEGLSKKTDLWLELGLQSSNDETLVLINRQHTAADFEDAVLRAAKRDIKVCAHLMIGLPGESRDDILDTVSFVSKLPVWGVKFHQVQIVKGTALETLWKEGEYEPITIDDYTTVVIKCLEHLRPDIVIHRLVGDMNPTMLVAPWGPAKFNALEKIKRALEEENTRQGRLWQGDN